MNTRPVQYSPENAALHKLDRLNRFPMDSLMIGPTTFLVPVKVKDSFDSTFSVAKVRSFSSTDTRLPEAIVRSCWHLPWANIAEKQYGSCAISHSTRTRGACNTVAMWSRLASSHCSSIFA